MHPDHDMPSLVPGGRDFPSSCRAHIGLGYVAYATRRKLDEVLKQVKVDLDDPNAYENEDD
jgi:hypothetical protein